MWTLGTRPHRWRRLFAARVVCVVLAAPFAASCTSVEIEDHSLQFNQATGSLGNRLLLLNTLRAAKGYPLQFSKVTNYTGQSRMDGSLSLSLPFITNTFGNPSGQRLQGTVSPSAQFKTGVQNLQLTDLNTAEFQKSLRTRVKANDFYYYRSQGWPKAVVNTVLIEEVYVEPRLLDALRDASEGACSDGGSGTKRRRNECRWLMDKRTQACLDHPNATEPRASPEGDVVKAFINDPRQNCRHVSFQWFFTSIRVLEGATLEPNPSADPDECKSTWAAPKEAKGDKDKSKDKSKDDRSSTIKETVKDGKLAVDVSVKLDKGGEKDEDGDKGRDSTHIGLNIPRGLGPGGRSANILEFPALHKLRNEYLCLLKEDKKPIRMEFRSPERMVRYLGEVLAVWMFGTGQRIQVLNEGGILVDLFRVERGRDLLGNSSAVAVEGPEREHFHIPIPETKDAHLSLQALALVLDALNLAVSGKELPRSTTLFVSGG